MTSLPIIGSSGTCTSELLNVTGLRIIVRCAPLTTPFYSLLIMNGEQLLALPGGRTLAYEHAGNLTSSTVVIFFLTVGDASRPNSVLISKGVHFISPTLPGYGNTSPPSHNTTYAATIAHDTTTLLDHLHARASDLSLYIGGGSFGTVAAQMLYGAPFNTFLAGRYVKGLLLISPFPPFRNDTEKGFVYTRSMP